jgi:glycosyltransferase involved in cell wall biosynthesis/UDP:flavonoid glycosyltransferase YjiC (YdhE family)
MTIDIIINGKIGLGHASRATVVARELYNLGERDIRMIAPDESQTFLRENLSDILDGLTFEKLKYHPSRFQTGDDLTCQRERDLFHLENGGLISRLKRKPSDVTFVDLPRVGLYVRELFPETVFVGQYHDLSDPKTETDRKKIRWASRRRVLRDRLTDVYLFSGLEKFANGKVMESDVPLFRIAPVVRKPSATPEEIKSNLGIPAHKNFMYVTAGGLGHGEGRSAVRSLYAELDKINLDAIGIDYVVVLNGGGESFNFRKNKGKIKMISRVPDGNNYINAAKIVLGTGGRGSLNEALVYRTPYVPIYTGDNQEVLGNLAEVDALLGGTSYRISEINSAKIQRALQRATRDEAKIIRAYGAVPNNGGEAIAKALVELKRTRRTDVRKKMLSLEGLLGPQIDSSYSNANIVDFDEAKRSGEFTLISRPGASMKKGALAEYSMEELGALNPRELRKVARGHKVHLSRYASTKEVVFDRKVRDTLDGQLRSYDLSHVSMADLACSRKLDLYAFALNVNLPERAELNKAELRGRLQDYKTAMKKVQESSFRELYVSGGMTTRRIALDLGVGRITDSDRILKRAVLDYKTIITGESSYKNISRASANGVKGLNHRQLYALAQEYGVQARGHLQTERLRRRVSGMLAVKPKVSVYMPTFNQEAFIEEAIETVMEQKYTGGIEICIANDASTDETKAIVERLQAKYNRAGSDRIIRMRDRPKNGGIGAASNTALQMCRGEYVAHLDPDDRIHKNRRSGKTERKAIAKLAGVLDETQGRKQKYGMVCSFFDYIARDGSFIAPGPRRAGFSRKEFREKSMNLSPMRMFRRRLYDESVRLGLGGFNEGLRNAVDTDFYLKIDAVCEKLGLGIARSRNTVYDYRVEHGANISRFRDEQARNSIAARERAEMYRSMIVHK